MCTFVSLKVQRNKQMIRPASQKCITYMGIAFRRNGSDSKL